MVWVFDIDDPYDPVYVGDSIFGGIDERPHSIAIGDGVAYVGIEDRFETLSLSLPGWPDPMAAVPTSGGAYSVALAGDTAYVAADGAGLRVFDVFNPSSPTEISFIETPGESDGVAVSGDLAAVADAHDGLRILDISQPALPVELGVCDTPERASRVVVQGDLASVADQEFGLRIIDLANPSVPTEVGQLAIGDGAVSVDVFGGVAYLIEPSDGLVLVDVANPSAPSLVATLPLAGALGLDVAVQGSIAVAVGRDGFHELVLRVVDVSTPASPVLRGSLDLEGWSSRVAILGSHAYVVSPGRGMTVVDISDADQPVLRGNYDPPSNAINDIKVSAGHAFLSDTRGELHVVDVADPMSPTGVDVVETVGGVGVGYGSGRAVISTGLYGVSVIDVSDCLSGEIFADGFESGDVGAWN
jgi:hypothetical protein